MTNRKQTVTEVRKAIDVLSGISNDPEMQELARRRMNDEIYKQSALSAAMDEGLAKGRAEGRAEGEAERAQLKAELAEREAELERLKALLAGQGKTD